MWCVKNNLADTRGVPLKNTLFRTASFLSEAEMDLSVLICCFCLFSHFGFIGQGQFLQGIGGPYR